MNSLVLQPPAATQLIEAMSNADYHANPAFSSSQIKDVLRSPAHFFANHIDPQRGEKSPATSDMNLGSLLHTFLLEPHKVALEYAVAEKFDRRTKQGKADAEAFEQANAGKIIVDNDDYQRAVHMSESLRNHPWLFDLMNNNYYQVESSIFYTDADTGLSLRARPDLHIAPNHKFPNGLIIDVKSTDDARPHAFSRTCGNFRYDISAAMYRLAMQAYYKTDSLADFYFAVVERNAPFNCLIFKASDDMLMIGEAAYHDAIATIADCLAINEWDGYAKDVSEINLPKYMA